VCKRNTAFSPPYVPTSLAAKCKNEWQAQRETTSAAARQSMGAPRIVLPWKGGGGKERRRSPRPYAARSERRVCSKYRVKGSSGERKTFSRLTFSRVYAICEYITVSAFSMFSRKAIVLAAYAEQCFEVDSCSELPGEWSLHTTRPWCHYYAAYA